MIFNLIIFWKTFLEDYVHTFHVLIWKRPTTSVDDLPLSNSLHFFTMSFKQDFPTPNSGNSIGNHCFSPQSTGEMWSTMQRMLKLCVSCWKMRNTGIKTRYPRPGAGQMGGWYGVLVQLIMRKKGSQFVDDFPRLLSPGKNKAPGLSRLTAKVRFVKSVHNRHFSVDLIYWLVTFIAHVDICIDYT